jgi:uncharacterized LabA/DUF88 family protein
MPKHRDQRVGVFVDIQNMYYSAKQFYNQKVNFAYILNRAVAGRKLVRAIAYVIKADIKEEENFFDALEKIGYDVRSKDLQTFYGGAKKGDWDVGIAMDIMRMTAKLDVVVLVSGDGDFKDLMEHVKALGCRAEVIAFRKTASSRILSETEEFIDLDKELDKVLIRDHHYVNKKPMESFQKNDQVIAHGALTEIQKNEMPVQGQQVQGEEKKTEPLTQKEGFQKEVFHKPEGGFHRPETRFNKPEGGFHRPETRFHKPEGGFHRPENGFHKPEGGGFRKEGFNRGFQRREPFQRREDNFEHNDPVSLLQKLNMDQPLLSSRTAKEPMPLPNLQKEHKEVVSHHEAKPVAFQEQKKEAPKETKRPEIKKKNKKEKQESMLKKMISKVTRKKEEK